LSKDTAPLESILIGGEKKDKKDKYEPPGATFPIGGESKLEDILAKEPPKEEKRKPPLPFLKEDKGGVKLEDILGGPKGEPKQQIPQKEERRGIPLTLQDILGSAQRKAPLPTYVGEVKVLDAYGNVRILKVKGEPVPIYEIRLPELSKDEEKLLKMVRDRAVVEIQIDPESIPDMEERRRIFLKAVKNMVREMAPNLSEGRIEILTELVVQNMIGYGRLDPLVRDDNLEEIMVIGTNKPVYVWHRRFNMCKTNIVFQDEKEILNIIERIAREVGRRIDQQSPLLDARLPDGSRVNATIPPISLDGPTITIRKFKKDPLTIIDLIKYGTLNTDVAALLWIFVDGLGVKPANILVAGGTGSGKTTTLNSLAMFIPPSERVISIEDTAELQLPIEHWVRLETRPPNVEGKGEITMDDLVKNTLRMRPDRIIVGEVRGPEARTMFTAMNTGHDGALYGYSIIQLSDGRFEPIGTLCSRLFEKYKDRIKKYRDMEYVELEENHFDVVSVGPDLKSGTHRVSRVWRRKIRKGERLVKITTRTGNEVILTKTHPFFVLYDGEIVRKEAEKLKAGDRVAVMMKSPKMPERKYKLSPEIYSGISDYYLVPDGEGDMEILGKRYRKVKNTGTPPENAEYLMSLNSLPVKIVRELEEKLAYIVGVILGSGHISSNGISATFDDEGCMRAFINAVKEHLPNSRSIIKDNGTGKVVTFNSKIFAEMLSRIFSIPKGKKLERWNVPDAVLHSRNSIRHFIAGLFDGNASVSGDSITLITKSESGARKIWHALQRLGIISTVSRHGNGNHTFRVMIRGIENLKRFYENIPINNTKRKKALQEIVENKKNYRGSYVYGIPIPGKIIKSLRKRLNLTTAELSRIASAYAGEKIPESLIQHVEHDGVSEIGRSALKRIAIAFQRVAQDINDLDAWALAKKLELLADGDVYWDEVVSVEEVEPRELGIEYLYDLTVEEDHNYVANGILVSNCMGTIHSNSARETIVRLESPPMNVPRIMIPALDIIIMQVRYHSRKKGTIRRITEIAEVSGIEGESIQLNKLYKYDPARDELIETGVPSRFMNVLAQHTGLNLTELEIEKEKRKLVLEWMIEKGIRGIEEVGHYIRQFYIDSEELLKRIERESTSAELTKKVKGFI